MNVGGSYKIIDGEKVLIHQTQPAPAKQESAEAEKTDGREALPDNENFSIQDDD